jgi:hypothetical protein
MKFVKFNSIFPIKGSFFKKIIRRDTNLPFDTNLTNNNNKTKYDEFDLMIKELSILSKKCLNNGKYVKLSELDTVRFKCICDENYTGLFCETSKDNFNKFILIIIDHIKKS